MLNRRHFLATCSAAAVSGFAARAAGSGAPFSFILLGDLHFDRWEHHDLKWLEAHKPGDLSQIRNYTRLTSEVMPKLFAEVKARIAALQATDAPPAFVVQVGDLVEGLCGNEELAALQNREAIEFVNKAGLGLPLLFTKGNHDVTGDGAVAAFDHVLQPYMVQQARLVDRKSAHAGGNYTATFGDTQFAFFDAYDKTSLDWLEAVAAARTARHLFVAVHPPVVPYGARASWYLYAGDKGRKQRDKLVNLLGAQEAMVLGGHLHKFASLTRVAGGKKFTQLAVSSVVSEPAQKIRDVLHGTDAYIADQVELEPRHSPETAAARRQIYDAERQAVTAFEYADTSGYAVVTVRGAEVTAQAYAGTATTPFQTVQLSV